MIRELAFTEEEHEGLNEILEYCYNIRMGINDMQNKSHSEQEKAEGLRKAIDNLNSLDKYKSLLNNLANELLLED